MRAHSGKGPGYCYINEQGPKSFFLGHICNPQNFVDFVNAGRYRGMNSIYFLHKLGWCDASCYTQCTNEARIRSRWLVLIHNLWSRRLTVDFGHEQTSDYIILQTLDRSIITSYPRTVEANKVLLQWSHKISLPPNCSNCFPTIANSSSGFSSNE